MRKILSLFVLTLMLTVSAEACCYRGGYYHHGYYGNGWVAPAIVGGVIGYEMARPRQPDVVIVQPQPVYPPPATPPWPQPADYHWEAILDANCGCYRTVLVHN